jgi:hypothetical protein
VLYFSHKSATSINIHSCFCLYSHNMFRSIWPTSWVEVRIYCPNIALCSSYVIISGRAYVGVVLLPCTPSVYLRCTVGYIPELFQIHIQVYSVCISQVSYGFVGLFIILWFCVSFMNSSWSRSILLGGALWRWFVAGASVKWCRVLLTLLSFVHDL